MLHVRNIYMWLTVAQFRVPNRNVASSVAWSLAACAQRVASTFETAHTVLEFTDSARASFLEYQTLCQGTGNLYMWPCLQVTITTSMSMSLESLRPPYTLLQL